MLIHKREDAIPLEKKGEEEEKIQAYLVHGKGFWSLGL